MKEKKEDIHYFTRELHAKYIQKIGCKVTICAALVNSNYCAYL